MSREGCESYERWLTKGNEGGAGRGEARARRDEARRGEARRGEGETRRGRGRGATRGRRACALHPSSKGRGKDSWWAVCPAHTRAVFAVGHLLIDRSGTGAAQPQRPWRPKSVIGLVRDPSIVSTAEPLPKRGGTPGIIAVGGGSISAAFDVVEAADTSTK